MKIKKAGQRAAIGVAGVAAVATAAAMLGAAPAHAEGTILAAGGEAVPNSYIVMLNDGTTAQAASDLASQYDVDVTAEFRAVNGLAIHATADEARALAADSAVQYVQQDGIVELAETQDSPPSWGLDRLDQEATEGDDSFTYPDSAGSGVTAYIVDTGIEVDHPDFEGRAVHGTDTVDNDDDATDGNGHGTHVAGTIGGASYGIAKDATLVAVRVLDDNGSGTYAGVIGGIDWVAENAEGPSVANMSLGGGKDQAVNDAVTAAVEAGVTFAVAAGNESSDACNVSPASTPEAITVAASDVSDAHASFSNYGSCVDIYAPGVDITSSWLDGGENTISGTSMATPHVVGAAALYLGENPDATPAEVEEALESNALADAISGAPADTENLLLNTAFLNGDGGEDPTDPTDPEEPTDPEDPTDPSDPNDPPWWWPFPWWPF